MATVIQHTTPLCVFIHLFLGGTDYDPIIDKWLTFNGDVFEVDIAVNITNDFLFEYNEILGVSMKLISEPFTGLELQDNTTIVIIDDDGMFDDNYRDMGS